jgi:hypothetical protein
MREEGQGEERPMGTKAKKRKRLWERKAKERLLKREMLWRRKAQI